MAKKPSITGAPKKPAYDHEQDEQGRPVQDDQQQNEERAVAGDEQEDQAPRAPPQYRGCSVKDEEIGEE
jgi:hypothetical protein